MVRVRTNRSSDPLGEGAVVLRRSVIRVGLLPGLVLGAGALGLVGGSNPASGAVALPAEFHAPRVPGPSVYTRVHHKVIEQWSSTNWSGYAITGRTYTGITGHWVVPQVQTPATKGLRKKAAYSSSWVGIDGYGNEDLIQAGTEQDWTGGRNGAPFYQAWWEILPAPETPISSLAISPGDAMVVTISKGVSVWTITVTDTTTGKSFSTQQSYSGPEQSAEWIQEAPTLGRRLATLADDGTVTFDPGTVNNANPGLVPADAGVMFKRRKQISTPSAPNTAGNGFAVAYGAVAPPAPS
jgi:hypothetical protein